MKLVFLDAKTVGDVPNLHLLNQFGEVVLYETTGPDQVHERIRNANIVITNKVVLTKETIAQVPNLKLICVAATGTNNIALDAAEAQNIPVKNVINYSTHSVAQLTFSLILQILNNIPYFDNYVKRGDYAKSDIFTHLGKSFREIAGKRYGIIGLGTIGRQVAAIAQAFGAEVVYYSASGKNTEQPYQQLNLEELLQTSDIVSVHAPLNQFTKNLLSYAQLVHLQPHAILINVGRGGIVNEADLARALDENLLAGAGIDVFEKEPIELNNPLLHLKNKEKLILTPHIAWASLEARTLLIQKIVENIQNFLSSKGQK